MASVKPNSELNSLLRRLQRTSVNWETYRQLQHQYSAGPRVQQYALFQSVVHPQPRWTVTPRQQQFQKWIQELSAYEMAHPVIDDALKVNTVINNLRGLIQQHPLLQDRPHRTWPEVRQMVDNFFSNHYMHLPSQTTGNVDQDLKYITSRARKEQNEKKKEQERKAKARATITASSTTSTTAATATTTANSHNKKGRTNLLRRPPL